MSDYMITLGNKSILTIAIENYEFKSITTHWDDFLNVNVEYCIEGRVVFKYVDACIMTTELRGLANKLHDFLSSEEESITIGFIEPMITFIITKDYTENLTFSIELEVNMKCGDYDSLKKGQVFDLQEFKQFIENIKCESERFPPRCK